MNTPARQLLRRIRILIGIVIGGLLISGVTAFPLLYEVEILHGWLGQSSCPTPIKVWLGIACLLVIPTALICGEIRGIPLWWRAIDSAFGVFGCVPLWFAARLVRRLEDLNRAAP